MVLLVPPAPYGDRGDSAKRGETQNEKHTQEIGRDRPAPYGDRGDSARGIIKGGRRSKKYHHMPWDLKKSYICIR